MATPTKPGIYLRSGSKASFSEAGKEIQDREIVISSDTGEIGTPTGWVNPAKLGGKVKNIYYAETPAERQDIYSTDPVIINGLSMTLTPETEKSAFIITAAVSSTFTYVASLLCFVNGTSLHSHGNNNNEQGSISTKYNGSNNTGLISTMPIQARYDATGTDDVTIDIRGTSGWGGSTYHMYINDRGDNDMRSISTMIVYEVERA